MVGVTNSTPVLTDDHEFRQSLKRQKRTFDLAMVASDMGTWCYALADNICVYDENAQRLYELTEARFAAVAAASIGRSSRNEVRAGRS
jgi:hypothetical protein